jgi:hypothetical protein
MLYVKHSQKPRGRILARKRNISDACDVCCLSVASGSIIEKDFKNN